LTQAADANYILIVKEKLLDKFHEKLETAGKRPEGNDNETG